MLADEQKKEYLENSYKCPYCNSYSIQAMQMGVDGNITWYAVYCESCHRRWTDVYKLVDVEEVSK